MMDGGHTLQTNHNNVDTALSVNRTLFPYSSPPPKSEAFEDFKADRGSELNRIFKENKSILGDRRRKQKEITQRINVIKKEIDVTSQNLNVTKLEREKQGIYYWGIIRRGYRGHCGICQSHRNNISV